MPVFVMLGRKSDLPSSAAAFSEAKYAAAFAISVGVSFAAISPMTGLLREPLFIAFICDSR